MMKLRMKALVATILLLTGSLMAMAENINIEVGGVNYSLDEATMTASVGRSNASGDLVLPQSVSYNNKDYALTSIGERAFALCENLTSITIPASVTYIADFAFDVCESLKDVYLYGVEGKKMSGYSFHQIGDKAMLHVDASLIGWYLCSQTLGDSFGYIEILEDAGGTIGVEADGVSYCLNEATQTAAVGYTDGVTGDIVLPQSVTYNGKTYALTSICDYAFDSSDGITSMTLPSGLKTIGEGAFRFCDWLVSINIPEGVKTIGKSAFSCCTKMESIHIPASVESIGKEFIRDCYSLKSIQVEEGNKVYDSRNNCNALIETATNTLIVGINASSIPNGIESIGECAFMDRVEFTAIDIPSGVTSIGNKAFGYNPFLTSVSIPASVASISGNPFIGCDNIETIQVESGNKAYDSRDNCNALIETATNKLITGSNASTIPYGVKAIGDYAFAWLDIPKIDIPATVTSFGTCAFFYCRRLASVKIPDGVTVLPYEVFASCHAFTSVEIPSGITNIGEEAFRWCGSLKDVYLYGTEVKKCCEDTFDDIPEDAVLHVDASLVDKYKTAEYWSDSFASIVALDATGIDNISVDGNAGPCRIYSIDGKQQAAMQKGINILRYKNGKTIKVMRK